MNFLSIIGFISSLVTFEEAGRSWITKIKTEKKVVNLNDWDSNDSIVQLCLDKFKTGISELYKDHIFTKSEIEEIVQSFFKNNSHIHLDSDQREKLKKCIIDIINACNTYTKSRMSSGEKVILNKVTADSLQINNKLEAIEEQRKRENIKRFLRAVESSKDIELGNIDEFINREYEIDRKAFLESIHLDDDKRVTIQGNAGSGKSVICKKLLSGKEYILATRAEKLTLGKSLNEIWDCDIEDAIQWLEYKKLYIYIDAIEFIADCGENAFVSLQEIYRLADKYDNVCILTSCRNTDSSAFMRINSKYKIKTYEISEIKDNEIDDIANKYPIINSLKKNKNYSDLLKLPFYINLIVSEGFTENNIKDENSFRELIWERVICLKEKCKKHGITQNLMKETVENIVFTRAKNFITGVDKDIIDSKILVALISEGIITLNENKVRLKYDIFEDICFERFIDKQFESCSGDYNKFFRQIEDIGRCIYRRYQIWISNKLFIKESRERFVYTLLKDKSIDSNWKKQTEIGIVKSKYCGLFFEEFHDLLDKGIIGDLINVTNLFAFEAKIVHTPVLSMEVIPIGAAREYLIRIASEKLKDDDSYRESLIKLCNDYANNLNKAIEIEKIACEIIINYIEILIEKCKHENSFSYSKDIVRLFIIVSKMTRASKQWLTNFIEKMIKEYSITDSKLSNVAENIFEAVVKNQDPKFVIALPELSCNVANTLLKQKKLLNPLFDSEYLLNIAKNYGLSDELDYYNNNGIFNYPFIWHIMQYNFYIGLNWAISFINDAIENYSKNNPEELINVDIYFSDINKIKTYYGNEYLWLSTTIENSIPLILSDIIYIINRIIINTINKKSNKTEISSFIEDIKMTLYEKSNNILLLLIIESIGMNLEKEFPGYAIDLASSMELIHWDIRRYFEFQPNPTKRMLNKQIFDSIGVPNTASRYNKDNKCAKSLQQYFMSTHFYGDEYIKKKCNSILDYLYSHFDEKNNPNDNLQIQKMDLRNASMTKLSDNSLLVTPQIHGEAKKIIESANIKNEKLIKISETLKKAQESINTNNRESNVIISSINILIKEMHSDNLIDIQYEKTLIDLIIIALNETNVSIIQKERLINEWLERLNKIFNNFSYIADIDLTIHLWQQLNSNINDHLKNHILNFMLKSILYEGYNNNNKKLTSITIYFLRSNEKYAKRFFATIIKLAEEEMNHQQLKAKYLKENNQYYKDYDFIPNLTPKLQEFDDYQFMYINKQYKNNKSKIIKNYLYNEKKLDISNFDINNYDIGLMCQLPCCGLTMSNLEFSNIIKVVIQYLIKIWCIRKQEKHNHEIINIFKESVITSFLQYELSMTEKDALLVYDILFTNVDFTKFTKEIIDFYDDILSMFLYIYIDGFKEKDKRSEIENKISNLEKYIQQIPVEWIKNQLEKYLFFSVSRYNIYQPNQADIEYSYKDKYFINQQICKFGLKHIKEVINTVNILNIEKVLPEILISIDSCFTYAISNNKLYFINEIRNVQSIVETIILKAFIYQSENIKTNKKLINAFENILISLTEIGNEKAAVLLDEFRIH